MCVDVLIIIIIIIIKFWRLVVLLVVLLVNVPVWEVETFNYSHVRTNVIGKNGEENTWLF